MSAPRVILGVAGASGAALGLSAARRLAGLGAEVDLVVSAAAQRTLATECGSDAWDELRALATRCHDVGNIDGILGAGTRAAVRAEQFRLGLPVDGWPTSALLSQL